MTVLVDAHIHLWESPTAPAHHRAEPLGADEAVREMDKAGVALAVNCPAIWDPRSNEVAIDAAQRFPDRLATMGWIPLRPGGDGAQLANWKQQPGMKGLRLLMLDPVQMQWLETGELDWIWRAAERYQIPVALTAPGAMSSLRRIAEAFPGMQLAIDHMGAGASGKAPAAFGHLPDLLRMRELPNVVVKVTNAPSYATDPYPFRSVHPYIQQIFDAFGPTRVFWGTDITKMPCSWGQCITMFTEEMPWLAGADREEVMGRAVCRWLDWKPAQ